MNADNRETNAPKPEFDFSSYPPDTLFHERREGRDRRHRADAPQPAPAGPRPADVEAPATPPPNASERRQKKERRRRIDPTTFEKQYSDEELEFMNAMQRFKELSGKTFPSYGDVLKVAIMLGYRRAVFDLDLPPGDDEDFDPSIILSSVEDN